MILPLILSLFTTLAFAIHPREGGGGNICFSKVHRQTLVLEEITRQDRDYRLVSPFDAEYRPYLSAHLSTKSNYNLIDLTKTGAYQRSLTKLQNFARVSPKMGTALIRILKSMKRVYASYDLNWGPYEPDENLPVYCERGSLRAAIVSHQAGFVMVSTNDWRLLDYHSQSILLIHEALRIFQIYSNIPSITNKEIGTWTMSIYDADLSTMFFDPAYQQVVKFYREKFASDNRVKLEQFKVTFEALVRSRDERAIAIYPYIMQLEVLRNTTDTMYYNPQYMQIVENKLKPLFRRLAIPR